MTPQLLRRLLILILLGLGLYWVQIPKHERHEDPVGEGPTVLAEREEEPESEQAVLSAKSQKPEGTLLAPGSKALSLMTETKPVAYRLDLTVDPASDHMEGTVEIDVQLPKEASAIRLNRGGLQIVEAVLRDGKGQKSQLAVDQNEAGLALVSIDQATPRGEATLAIRYRAPFRDHGPGQRQNQPQTSGLLRIEQGGRRYVVAGFDPSGAALFFPGFYNPLQSASFSLTLRLPAGQTAFATMPLTGASTDEAGFMVMDFDTTPPMPAYQLAFVAGELDAKDMEAVDEDPARSIPLRGIAPAGKTDELSPVLAVTASLLPALEQFIGVAYPYPGLDLVAIPDYPAAAGVVPGMVLYNQAALPLDQVSPQSLDAFREAHGRHLAYQWFGAMVTPSSRADGWLSGALSSWAERRGRKQAYDVMDQDSGAVSRPVLSPSGAAGPLSAAVDPFVRRKGLAILTMVEGYVGAEQFGSAVRQYLEKHQTRPADTNAFLTELVSLNGEEALAESMRDYLRQTGFPAIDVSATCPPGGGVNISLGQSPYSPVGGRKLSDDSRQWDTPVCMTLVQKDGRRERQCVWLRRASQTFYARKSMCPEALMPDAEGRGYYRWSMDETGWSRLAAVFGRLDEGEAQSYAANLSAALWSGRLDFGRYRELLVPVAERTDEIATEPLKDLGFILQQFAGEPETLEALESWARSLYAPPSDVATEDTADPMYQRQLTAFYFRSLKDEAVGAALAAEGRALLSRLEKGEAAAFQALSITGDLALLALVQQGAGEGRQAGTRLLQMLNRMTDTARERVLWALARSGDEALAEDLLDQIVEDNFLSEDALQVLSGLLEEEGTRAQAWTWLEGNLDQLLEVVPGDRAKEVLGFGRFFCSVEGREKVVALMGPVAVDINGGQRAFDVNIEAIDICLALSDMIREQVRGLQGSASHPLSSEPVEQPADPDLR